MKNHWLEVYRRKQAVFWTVEFARNSQFLVKPRRVGVENAKHHLGQLGQGGGNVSVIFNNSMTNMNDHELLDFLSEITRQGMANIYSRLRKFQGIMSQSELENFELTGLDYPNIGMGNDPNDIKLTFKFQHIRHFQIA